MISGESIKVDRKKMTQADVLCCPDDPDSLQTLLAPERVHFVNALDDIEKYVLAPDHVRPRS